jgi:RloB-like protein
MAGRVPPSLRRRQAYREPQRRFTIVCEGKNTEPAYFKALKATIRDARVVLDMIPAAGVPMTIAERSVELVRRTNVVRRKRGRVDSYEENDEVWAVFDRDKHDKYAEAVMLCENKGVRVARSNPCFEVWIILHHTDFDRPDDSHAVQVHLETLCPEYDAARGKRPDCVRFIHRIEDAERRAERQLASRKAEGMPFGPPSTTVFGLTRAIRLAASRSRGLAADKPGLGDAQQ